MRRLLAMLVMCTATLLLASCGKEPEGAPHVLVIGTQPRASDPTRGPLSAPDAVLLENMAQGLVRFDAAGNIVGGLAERWNVSDDGLSYIFRIASTNWSDGRKVTAQQVARILKRSLAPASANPLKDTLGAIEDIVAMTDRVIEIRLKAPRPNLLATPARPEFATVRGVPGTGAFNLALELGPAFGPTLQREV